MNLVRNVCLDTEFSWWRHQMETFSALLAICVGNSAVPGEFPAQRPVTRSFDVFFDLHWINGWANNREAGDLRRYHAHYDVTVMCVWKRCPQPGSRTGWGQDDGDLGKGSKFQLSFMTSKLNLSGLLWLKSYRHSLEFHLEVPPVGCLDDQALWCCITVLVVNYGIPNTIVLEIP